MEIINHPPRNQWKTLLERPYRENTSVRSIVQEIFDLVAKEGDAAIRSLSKKFDGADLQQFKVSEEELESAEALLAPGLKAAILQAKQNIEGFHAAQVEGITIIETTPGIQCWRKAVAIDKVGLYIPGGTAPLFSTVLMLGVPAQLAGCREVVLCSPASGPEGALHPAILFAARLVGIRSIYKVGGAQAIAAMAFGTETIPAVYKIFGPGNQYVTAAKQLVQAQGVAIDMPAGPSEVCILADETADPRFVAADLLSQAEHGADSQVILVSTSADVVEACLSEVEAQVARLPRNGIASKALLHSKALVCNSMEEAIDLVNEYAAEHLIISCADAESIAEKVTNAGSVFIGSYSPESAGDYASGTNHTLPTNGYARAYSGVSVDSFVKKITFQKLSREGLAAIGDTVIRMAEAEGLTAHAEAVRVRLQDASN